MASTALNPVATEHLLKRTTSRCPTCHAACPAEVWHVAGKPARVFLRRTCPTHGPASVCIASDARFYWLAKGRPENAGDCCCSASPTSTGLRPPAGVACCASDGSLAGTLGRNAPGRGDAPFEKLSTCLALIEIVTSCNLSCPTCYADSPVAVGRDVDAIPLADLQRRIQGVIDRKDGIEILQLSGGEPTLHPQFFELVDWVQTNPGIDYLLLNTNGVRIANDQRFATRLAEAAHRGRLQLYLQFDGRQPECQHFLRGADLRATRVCAIARCQEINLPITLAMTVTSENLASVWDAIEFGLGYPHIRGISFQPMFGSGRVPRSAGVRLATATPPSEGNQDASPAADTTRLNTADIILAAVDQSRGRLRFEDFTPLPCGDPNCATIGYLLKARGRTYSISDFIDFTRVQDFLRDKVRYRLDDLRQCGCESEPLGELLRRFEMDESNTFRIFIKPFMDAWTWDEDRIDRCCTHVIRPDGKLDSFCRYYSGFPDSQSAP
jgi:uncharacterized radical SAM superfamily Fe-S cluster-containing enzyme